jgi:hypothetical protein
MGTKRRVAQEGWCCACVLGVSVPRPVMKCPKASRDGRLATGRAGGLVLRVRPGVSVRRATRHEVPQNATGWAPIDGSRRGLGVLRESGGSPISRPVTTCPKMTRDGRLATGRAGGMVFACVLGVSVPRRVTKCPKARRVGHLLTGREGGWELCASSGDRSSRDPSSSAPKCHVKGT